jgi:hypothetical protein
VPKSGKGEYGVHQKKKLLFIPLSDKKAPTENGRSLFNGIQWRP